MEFKKHILIIEDDEVILSLLKELLESENYYISTAENGETALALLSEKIKTKSKPDLILLDLMMPVMNGFQFMKKQSEDPEIKNIPVVVMSADSQIKEKLRNTTAVTFFRKPVKIATIIEIIERLTLTPALDGHDSLT
jgi:CheY-like chemotaxis protein